MTSRTPFLKLYMHTWRHKRHFPDTMLGLGLGFLFCPLHVPLDGLPTRFSRTCNPYMPGKCRMPLTETRGFFTAKAVKKDPRKLHTVLVWFSLRPVYLG